MASSAQGLRRQAEHAGASLPPLMVAAERIATTVAPGIHGRRRVGQGETFWQFRRYQFGDPAQTIDWRQSAKSQPLYVRQTEWEAAQSVWLWRDGSPSMRYRSHKSLPTKADRTELLLLTLAILLVRGGENVALLGVDRAPSHGAAAVDRLTLALMRGAGIPERSPKSGEPGLPEFDLLPRYSQLVLVADFLAPLEMIDERMRRFAARHIRGHLLQVLDPAELSLPFSGRTRFEGLEHEGNVLIRRVEQARTRYLARIEAQCEGLRRLARNLDWSYTSHCTDRPPQTALLATYTALSAMLTR